MQRGLLSIQSMSLCTQRSAKVGPGRGLCSKKRMKSLRILTLDTCPELVEGLVTACPTTYRFGSVRFERGDWILKIIANKVTKKVKDPL